MTARKPARRATARPAASAAKAAQAAAAAPPAAQKAPPQLQTVERALAVRASGAITIKDLQLPVRRPRSAPSVSKLRAAPPAAPDATPLDLNLRGALEHVERQLIDAALARTGGNRTEAAALLGLNRSTLLEKMRKLRG